MIDHEGSVSTLENDHRMPLDIMMVPDNAEFVAAVEHYHDTALEQTPVDITDHDSQRIGMMMCNDIHVKSIVINKDINGWNHNDAFHMIEEAILHKDEYGYSDADANSKNNKKVGDHRDTRDKNRTISQQKQPGVFHVAGSTLNDVIPSSTRNHYDGDDVINQQLPQMYQQDIVHHTVVNHPSHSSSFHKKVDQKLIKVNQESYHYIDLNPGGDSVLDHIVQLQDDDGPYEPNSDNTTNLPSGTKNLNSNVLTNGRKHKVRYDATNGIIPGAVRVVGNNLSRDDSDSQSSNGGDGTHSASNHEIEYSSRNKDVYHGELAPVELLEKVDAVLVPRKDPTKTNACNQNSDRGLQRFSIKHRLAKLLILLVLILFVISATVMITMWCGKGNCHPKATSSAAPTSSSTNNTQQNVIMYKSFETKQELVGALDQFLSGRNITSVEGTYGNISLWNVSQIQDFSYLFSPFGEGNILIKSKFKEDVSRWDVSSATNMSYMFYGAQEFRGDISKWNVSRVTDVQYFMSQADKFDGNLSKWDTSQFVNTSYMFYRAITFSGTGLEDWNVSNVYDMSHMFGSSFDCYSSHNVFSYCTNFTNFDGNLSNWDVSNVRYMAFMFCDATSFKGVGLENWNTSKIETMSGMFQYTESFDANLSLWDTSNMNDASWMFYDAKSFKGVGLENWDTSKIETMSGMFQSTTSFDANLSLWDMANVNDASSMFGAASSFQGIGVENWNTSNVQTMYSMFNSATSFNANLSLWDMSNVNDVSMMFAGASSFQGAGVENWDTSKIETMNGMFLWATSFNANLSLWYMSKVHDASWMFHRASSFQGAGVENWDTNKIETMSHMFESATSFDANLSSWDVNRVFDMSFMFKNASSFHGAGINEWNAISVRYTTSSFAHATSFDTNLSKWDVANVMDMSNMFDNAIAFHGKGLDLWNVSLVNNTAYMFASAISFNADLSLWDISSVENTTDMFTNATSFEGVFWWNDTFVSM